MKAFILILACNFIGLLAVAQNSIIEGKILTEKGSIAQNVSVQLDKNIAIIVDKEGKYRFDNVTSGEHTVKVSHMSFIPKSTRPDAHVHRLFVKNYGDSSMHVLMELEPTFAQNFSGSGILNVRAHDKQIVMLKSPEKESNYLDKVKSLIYRLHFGDFGGYPLKVVYFILGIMGCLVITSGILIWLVARDKNNVIPRKRKFNSWMANFFMAICLSMFPVTAFTFIVVKWFGEANQTLIYQVFFWSWLFLILVYTFRKSIK
jgi:hypothetical protein